MSSPVHVSAEAVQQLISQDIASAEQLAKLLDAEHELLQERDQQRLANLLTEKQTLMQRLEASARQRSLWVNYLVQHTGLSTQECWNRLLQELGDSSLPTQWQEFQRLIDDCKQRNEMNGKTIARGQRTLKHLLGILRGQTVDAPSLYTASGNSQTGGSSHTVVKA